MKQNVLKETDIIEKKFSATKNGYNPFEVDKFLDAVTLSINELFNEIKNLNELNQNLSNKIDSLNAEKQNLEEEFIIFKNKFKNIKESDFIDNKSSVELLKKVNIYEKKLASLGVDITKLK
jgi:cell division initiation protein